MPTKNSIREQLRGLRDGLDRDAILSASTSIADRLLQLSAVRTADHWFIYVSAGSEVHTHSLIRQILSNGWTVTVPKVVGPNEMIAERISSFEDLYPGKFGFLEPMAGDAFAGKIEVAVCPGVGFSERGDRLGSGCGFYDRYLAANPPRLAIGLAFETQVVAELPTEAHDRRMDFVITEKRVIHPDRASR